MSADRFHTHTASTSNSPLSEGQQLALLVMRRSDLSKAVLGRLVQARTPGPAGRHFYEVARMELAIHQGSFHQLTPRGRYEAERIAREIARALELHVVTYDLGGPGRAARASCSCCWSVFRTRAISSYLVMLSRDADRHLRHQDVINAQAASC